MSQQIEFLQDLFSGPTLEAIIVIQPSDGNDEPDGLHFSELTVDQIFAGVFITVI